MNGEVTELELRPVVKWFAQEMEKKMRENDYKGKDFEWRRDGCSSLFLRLLEESRELSESILVSYDTKEVIGEAADVANFAMMVADTFCFAYIPNSEQKGQE